MKIVVVIPAYNEEQTVGDVVRSISMIHDSRSMIQTIVVDDGSSDKTAQVARLAGAFVLRHPINRGLGAALSTGIAGALKLGADVMITLDGDGQHDPAEIPSLIAPIVKGEAEVVLGSRFMKTLKHENIKALHNIPRHRQIANLCGNLFTWLLFGIWVSDSQSGFRAFSANAARQLRLRTSTMEVSSEIIREIARLGLNMKEVPITVSYTKYSLSKGQGFFRGLQTLWKLIVLKFFR
ncbi:glycosyltransferase family 2 protein [Candidatus Uhrbacteria bacterium]|nr:glycosyltransferase family 2 protein [Candidatus Uhrbacteria bacterium]